MWLLMKCIIQYVIGINTNYLQMFEKCCVREKLSYNFILTLEYYFNSFMSDKYNWKINFQTQNVYNQCNSMWEMSVIDKFKIILFAGGVCVTIFGQ